ncbi:MAG TPA: hypothetical protein VK363_12675 [Pyrinomonadaceae bacterium]|nr:hypothetical protein [Pyrinomonadaceae bacterium]
MKNHKEKKAKRNLKASLKRATKAVILAGGILISNPSVTNASKSQPKPGAIQERVKTVRESLLKKLHDNQSTGDKLSYSENELAQWGNWGNWGNWNNWRNWNNWNNWGNWGNWRNY